MIFSKRLFSYFVLLTTLSSMTVADSATCCETKCEAKTSCDNYSKNLWQPRAFSSYRTREMILLQDKTKEAHEEWVKTWSVSAEYMKSFGDSECRLGGMPFWSGTNTMTIGTNDGTSDLDAYQFGLGNVTKQGSITLRPSVQHVGGEFMWRLLQKSDDAGFYCSLKVPVGAMMIKHNITEDLATIEQVEENWTKYTVLEKRHKSITDALVGGFENKEPDFKFGRLAKERISTIRCGDIEAAAGYNIYVNDKGYFGLGFKFSAPTGNVPNAKYMLEPIFGRAGHWGVGGEFHGCWHIHEGDGMEVDLQFRGDVLHLTPGRAPNWRSFDLALNGKGSKYMLLQMYKTAAVVHTAPPSLPNNTQTAVEVTTTPQFLEPAINVTTFPVLSRIAVEGSAAVMLDFKKDCWNMSLTGEFWGRSRECLEINTCRVAQFTDQLNLNDWAVLGRQIDRDDRFYHKNENFYAQLYLCEPAAKINESLDKVLANTDGTTMFANPNGIGPMLTASPAPDGPAGPAIGYDTTKIKDARVSANRIPADPSVALDVAGAEAARVFTGKVTGEFGYTWKDHENMPHLGLFGGVEFADKTSRFVNYWSVGVQGSAQF